jgi:hypothetical protein
MQQLRARQVSDEIGTTKLSFRFFFFFVSCLLERHDLRAFQGSEDSGARKGIKS